MANNTIYPYGTGGSLPSSIGIINDLTTGGADKALSAEQGKFIGEIIGEDYLVKYININLAVYTAQDCSLGGSKKWYISGSSGRHIAIPVTAGAKYRLKLVAVAGDTESSSPAYYGFVTSSYSVPYSTGSSVPYADSGDRISIKISDGEEIITASENAAYLILNIVDGGGNSHVWKLDSVTTVTIESAGSISKRLSDSDDIIETVKGYPHEFEREVAWNDFAYQTNNTRLYSYLAKSVLAGDVLSVSWSEIDDYEYNVIVLTANTWGQGSVVSESGWITSLNYTKTINATENGNYIRISVRKSNDASLAGEKYTILGLLSLSYKTTETENINGLVQYVGEPSLDVESEVVLSNYAENLGSLGSSSWYIDSSNPIQRHKAVPITPNTNYRIGVASVSAGTGGYWTFVTNLYTVPSSNGSTVPKCVGGEVRNVLNVGTYVDVISPLDAAYLIITTVDGGGASCAWNVYNLAPKLKENLFESVKGLKNTIKHSKIRVASWNLGHFALGTDSDTKITHDNYTVMKGKWAEHINDINADIFFCEEYNTNFVNASGDNPAITAKDAIFSLYANNYIGAKETYNQNAIFSNLLLSNNSRVDYDSRTQTRYYLVSTVSIGGENVKIVCTHLDFNQGTTGQQNRANQMNQLISDFADDEYVIICADWNTNDGGSEFDVFAQAGYKMANHGYLGDLPTYPAGGSPNQILDNIITKGLSVSGIHIVNDGDVTDHCCIYCDLTLIPE